ncbi:peptidylprolyl isomerase [Paenibacillus sp. GCM10023252]|uniref:peptidylprolyl isomerase n=1 Tax=Paenibacillus sp. GCM10023252 TaxID=3252649 RepID=UPI00360B4918
MNNDESQRGKDEENKLNAAKNEQLDQVEATDAEIERELEKELDQEAAHQAPVPATDADNNEPAPIQVPVTSQDTDTAEQTRNGKGPWVAISTILAIALVAVSIFAFTNDGASGEAVATVNGVDITKDQLYDAMVVSGGASTVDNLITNELIKQEADKAKVTVTDEDVNKEIDTLKKQFNTEEEFNAALAQYNMTIDDLKRDAKSQVQIKKILEPKTKVSDEDIQKFYDENKASLGEPEQVKASHILVATKEEADAILKELKGGADFATVAKEKSTDPGSKDKGGDLGFFGKGENDPALEEAAFKLEKGQLSEVVQGSNGFHIIKKTDSKAAVIPTLEDKKAEIKDTLVTQQVGELSQQWLTDLKAQAKITNTLAPAADPAADAPAAQ